MSRDRFEQIFRCLHFTNVFPDGVAIPQEERQTRNKEEPFWLMGDFIKELAWNSMRYVIPSSRVSIDEMSVWFKGKHRCRCFNPNKPEKFHLKAFCLNDPETGYYYIFTKEVKMIWKLSGNKWQQRWPHVLYFSVILDSTIRTLYYVLIIGIPH